MRSNCGRRERRRRLDDAELLTGLPNFGGRRESGILLTMRLHALRLWQFRNYARAELAPSPRVNILLGANAQGKTNLLEAIYYLSALRPLRPVREADLIQWGATEMRLYAQYEIDGLLDDLQMRLPL
ncbi:MAG: hypothetical protein N2554_10570 [Fimbriimonadales bacterium]|nr:hypothetical protein [Fimbriimonadales bacterium]